VKVFISWSGAASRSVAEALAVWFPKVIQGVEPFVSAKDIDKGANWTVELARELEDAQFGIICLTPDNLLSPWLNYEAGAITKSVSSRVCPVLHGVEKATVRPPIAQLQMTALDAEDMTLLMSSMNKTAGSPLMDAALAEAVRVWWPMLESEIGKVAIPNAPVPEVAAREPEKPQSSESELLEEVLQYVRSLDARIRILDRTLNPVRSRRLSPFEEITRILRREGVVSHEGRMTSTGLVLVCDDLPDPLPGALYDELGEFAKRRASAIRLEGPNERMVEFDGRGLASEPPF